MLQMRFLETEGDEKFEAMVTEVIEGNGFVLRRRAAIVTTSQFGSTINATRCVCPLLSLDQLTERVFGCDFDDLSDVDVQVRISFDQLARASLFHPIKAGRSCVCRLPSKTSRLPTMTRSHSFLTALPASTVITPDREC